MTDEESPTPRLFDHTLRVYEEMLNRSTQQQEVVDGEYTGRLQQVYEGHLTVLFSDLQIANPYYTKVVDMLKGQNCMVQIRRGGGKGLSKWELITPPTEEGFRAIMERKTAPKGRAHILEQQIKGLVGVVNDLIDRVEDLEKTRAS